MKRSTALIFFFVLMGFGGLFYLVVAFGLYPVAIVNGSFISSRLYSQEFHATLMYYNQVLSEYETANGEEFDVKPDEFIYELRKVVLDDLIEKRLISQLLEELIGDNVESVVSEKIAAVDVSQETLPTALRSLYGLSLEDFTDLVLVPQAEREILESHLALTVQNLDFNTWLRQSRQEASVRVISDSLFWDGERVEHKER
ncbi:MAG: hypothetical protein COU08_00700 [Candidatus Harrisonbacteria bacterium CG10_big_fil_rev_8_21_14_0_10_42_17]|uniref:PpiC domain-containing protein n=1 Tax=Candidatus Harrisonbacteria bacterium CG10_big_fil_rev_8_21_14_0_10_42_17 TaxID=1974584 RepID=A0A2M6WJ14_9BACT|nr:MAG: hypothetical protein COU08_00700 [Candidatus Harrisonbacteria bacterium CG10_big_fil_rev_8_21_14_0_10_42_17]